MRLSWTAGHDAARAGRRFAQLMRSPTTTIGLAPYSPTKSFRAMSAIPAFAKSFPDSTAVPSTYFRWPGTTESSTSSVRRILEENDRRYDIYEKVRYAHNHFPHSALTRYALGAPPKLLEDTWKHDEEHLAPLDPETDDRDTGDLSRLPKKITRENWDDPKTLGFKDAYSRYLVFFHEEISRLGPVGAVEEYVFSPQANWSSRNGHDAPQMLVRMVAGVLHPFIHTGFGLEFKDVVVLAEGLAEAAIHDHGIMHQLFPLNWPEDELSPQTGTKAETKKDEWGQAVPASSSSGPSLLEIYGEFASNDRLAPPAYNPNHMINDRLKAATGEGRAKELVSLAQKWNLDDEAIGDGPNGFERRLEEVAVLVTLVACASGRSDKPAKIDFFLMHALTSSMFLPAYMSVLDAPRRRAVLRTYLLGVLAMVIARGKPAIDFDYLMQSPLISVAPGTTPERGAADDVLSEPGDEETRNGWGSIVESSLYATDSHVPKAIRPLLHYASLYGTTPAGGFLGTSRDGQEVVPGISKIDGTIFVRGAGMVMNVIGWCREGEEAGSWTVDPIGYDEVWK